jgi:hypothetical protein
MYNMAFNLAPFGRWTLRDKAAQRRLALRYAANPKPTNSQKDAFKISPIQPSLCGLDRLLYNSRMDKLGRSS